MEGKSADGSLSQIRDSKTEAILPIKGKLINTAKAGLEKTISSEKFKFILQVLGIQIGKESKFRYNKVKILTDADSDGMHISVLLIVALWKYAPELIIQNRLSVIFAPLYGVEKGGKFIPIYKTEELKNYQNDHVIRFKGIGEMSPKQLETCIRQNLKEYIVNPPKDKQEEENILLCLTDSELKRKLCNNTEFSFETIYKQL